MSRELILTRQYCGIVTRIECMIRPLAGAQGLWSLVCAAGMDGLQPSEVRAQGPFHGRRETEATLREIVARLVSQGYRLREGLGIWQLHLHGELRRENAARGHRAHRQNLPWQ